MVVEREAAPDDALAALDALPGVQPSGTDLQAQSATGTDGEPILHGSIYGSSKAATPCMEGAKRGESTHQETITPIVVRC